MGPVGDGSGGTGDSAGVGIGDVSPRLTPGRWLVCGVEEGKGDGKGVDEEARGVMGESVETIAGAGGLQQPASKMDDSTTNTIRTALPQHGAFIVRSL